MYVAVSTQSFPDRSLHDVCEAALETGFDKLELYLHPTDGPLQAEAVAEDPDRFVSEFRDATRLTPIAFYLGSDVSPETMAGLAKAAKHLKVTQVTVPASPPGTPFNDEVDRLRAHVAAVTPEGCRLSIRTRTGELSGDPHTAVELCDAVKGLGLTYDPSYFVAGPHAGAEEVVFPKVEHVHLRDTSPDKIQVPAGLGEIDYAKLIARLEKEGYVGALAIDLFPDDGDAETRSLELRKIRMLLETLL